MKKTRVERPILNNDIIKFNTYVNIINTCCYLFSNTRKKSDDNVCVVDEEGNETLLSKIQFIDNILNNYYLEGTLCWQNKEINESNTFIEFELLSTNKEVKLEFNKGFTNFNLSDFYEIHRNNLYCCDNEKVDIIFELLGSTHLYVDLRNVVCNIPSYYDNTEYINRIILDLIKKGKYFI